MCGFARLRLGRRVMPAITFEPGPARVDRPSSPHISWIKPDGQPSWGQQGPVCWPGGGGRWRRIDAGWAVQRFVLGACRLARSKSWLWRDRSSWWMGRRCGWATPSSAWATLRLRRGVRLARRGPDCGGRATAALASLVREPHRRLPGRAAGPGWPGHCPLPGGRAGHQTQRWWKLAGHGQTRRNLDAVQSDARAHRRGMWLAG